MPTTASMTFSAARLDPYMDPEDAPMIDVGIAASLTLAKGTILGEVTATPGKYKAYASGNSDGSQVPKVILAYAVTTDASGNITVDGEFGQTRKTVSAYIAGTFLVSDLTGLDANAMTVMKGRQLIGDVTAGLVRFG